MPSSGVSDGVQSLIQGLYPQSIFCAIETSGDGKVNVQSRVQMFLFKARQAAQKEYTDLLDRLGLTRAEVAAFFEANPRYGSPLHRAPHAAAGTAADRLVEIAPLVGKGPVGVRIAEARRLLGRALEVAKATPAALAKARKKLVERSPVLLAQAKEEWVEAKPALAELMRERVRDGVDGVKAKLRGRRPTEGEARAAA
jgi:hypothetical protein